MEVEYGGHQFSISDKVSYPLKGIEYMEIKPEVFEIFTRLAKPMKCTYATVKGSCIYGTDENFAHLSLIEHTEPLLWEMEGFVIDCTHFTIHPEPRNVLKAIDHMALAITVIKNNYPVRVNYLGLQGSEQFMKIMAKKAYEGVSFLNIEGYLMSINKSLIPINKSDKIDLNIRDLDNGNFCAEYIIKKGKNFIYKYFMFLKL